MTGEQDGLKANHASMEGGGFYNRNSALQAAGNAMLLPLWEKVCSTTAFGQETLVVVDYGSSQGRNSMAPLRGAIEELRHRAGPQRPIQIFHNDLASNDFSSLFQTLDDDQNSYMVGSKQVFPAIIGRSYLSPILPPESVHLGWNSWTMQWMSRIPVEAPDHVFPDMSRSATVLEAAKVQQAVDWRDFITARSYEMRPGAKLLSAFTGGTAEGSGWEWLGGELWGSVLDMGLAGLLSEDEQRGITLPVSTRTLEEVRAPFSESGGFAGVELEQAEVIKIPDPFWDEYQRSGSPQQLAQSHANTTRGWAGPSIARHLEQRRDRTAFLDDLFQRFAQRIAANPQKHETHLCVAVLAKPSR